MSTSVLASPWLRWGLLALVQLGLIAVPLAERLTIHATGQEVTLEVRPVDPRDLLRGDYVIINLAIAHLDGDLPGLDRRLEAGARVHVVLEADANGIHQPTAVLDAAPADGRLAIAGTVDYGREAGAPLAVDYGLDAFFVPEGEGRAIEEIAPERMHLVAAVTRGGRSTPLRLLVDGKAIESATGF
ncbi:GDYXXLXY domain-containing protein [Polymorphum gilvum]|uniref:Hypothetical conserved membrane protein n=1 Tax=Polymorphum gilvum (strain LMG 25793 / CGMCC 1.9160 / SL003B-26A1) TaxID=991905 RepID=F2IWA4_POLGS|nr:GDYXXLXY domain-containing protein [Polymorphum gilvum]ADZ71489.1 Hypothetical conserved membrane protein [Polymorphum gilvum SL003B-26A1]